MTDGIEQISDDEVRLVRDGVLIRSVTFENGDEPSVSVTRTLRPDPVEGNPRDIFDVEVRDLQDEANRVRRCGFCDKTSAEVPTLIAGAATYICSECIATCSDILAGE